MKFDIKDIKIFNIDNKVVSIKKEIDIKNNFDIIEIKPADNCFYEAFWASLDIYKNLKKILSSLSYYKKIKNIISRYTLFKQE